MLTASTGLIVGALLNRRQNSNRGDLLWAAWHSLEKRRSTSGPLLLVKRGKWLWGSPFPGEYKEVNGLFRILYGSKCQASS